MPKFGDIGRSTSRTQPEEGEGLQSPVTSVGRVSGTTWQPKVKRPAEAILDSPEFDPDLPGGVSDLLKAMTRPEPGSREERAKDTEAAGWWRHRASGGPAGGSLWMTETPDVIEPKFWIGCNTPSNQAKNGGGLSIWLFIMDPDSINHEDRTISWTGKVVANLTAEQVESMKTKHKLHNVTP
jgi:hypothetical protein